MQRENGESEGRQVLRYLRVIVAWHAAATSLVDKRYQHFIKSLHIGLPLASLIWWWPMQRSFRNSSIDNLLHCLKPASLLRIVLQKLSWLGHVTAEPDISEDQLGLSSAPGSWHAGPAQMSATGWISIRDIGASSEPGPTLLKPAWAYCISTQQHNKGLNDSLYGCSHLGVYYYYVYLLI